ncbi:MAG: hypothetical protein P8175_16295 [Deltaproteobacteria bacterium]|jgi:hypothetical protein
MKKDSGKLKISVKYCGGCNPLYDRVELVEKIRASLRGKAELVSRESKGSDMVLAVQGCSTA